MMDMGNLMQEKPTCYECSPISKIETTNPLTGAVTPIKLSAPTYDTVEKMMTREEIHAEYEAFKPLLGEYGAGLRRDSKLKKLDEFERAQSYVGKRAHAQAPTSTEEIEDRPESEDIPPNYDVDE
jgi:hypothetical protein